MGVHRSAFGFVRGLSIPSVSTAVQRHPPRMAPNLAPSHPRRAFSPDDVRLTAAVLRLPVGVAARLKVGTPLASADSHRTDVQCDGDDHGSAFRNRDVAHGISLGEFVLRECSASALRTPRSTSRRRRLRRREPPERNIPWQ